MEHSNADELGPEGRLHRREVGTIRIQQFRDGSEYVLRANLSDAILSAQGTTSPAVGRAWSAREIFLDDDGIVGIRIKT